MNKKLIVVLSALMVNCFADNIIGGKYTPEAGDQKIDQENNFEYYSNINIKQYKTKSNNLLTVDNGVITEVKYPERLNKNQLKTALGNYYSEFSELSNNQLKIQNSYLGNGNTSTEITLKSVGNVKRYS